MDFPNNITISSNLPFYVLLFLVMSVFDNVPVPKVLYEVDSKYNGKITVMQVGKTRKLLVDRVSQSLNWDSPAAAAKVWGRVVDVLKENEPDLKNVLILGLGGGTMQHLISRAFPEANLVSVEIDPIMIGVAKQFFDVDKIPNHKIINANACAVIVEPEKYDIYPQTFSAVIVDIYIGDKYPDLGKSGNFMSALTKLAYPGGLVVFNRIYLEAHQDDVNIFIESVHGFLNDVKSLIIAGVTNSDNVLIFGRT